MNVSKTTITILLISFCGHAGETHKNIKGYLAPYNLRWGMSYEEARNIPLYSIEIDNQNYANINPDFIRAEVDPQELGAMKYKNAVLYFDKGKGLQSVLVRTDVDRNNKLDNGREALSIYNDEVKLLDHEYGFAYSKQEFIEDANKFHQSIWFCREKQQDWSDKGLDINKIANCSQWQRYYKNGRVTVLLTIQDWSVTKQYIFK